MNTTIHTVGVPFPQAFASPSKKRSLFPGAPRYSREPGLPDLSELVVRSLCPLGENARPSIKKDSYADFSLCATVPFLLGSILPFFLRVGKVVVLCCGSGLFIPRLKDGSFQAR